ncbi:YqaJ viral recombinase family protein [Bifidobacterium pseudolongum subsp. globosum]|uniref:YqaJ viral recombinase family nuclease n=1 Tax=Bifidobacterium pseudolongum TaxID=1694 RepID=UPI001F52C764|nr:YqaJ viral recombinase family protein [Bifidobacterium pseudolongum]MCI1195395.1 YqaJ viral recombinase family protein [Bifidobacterium pseudolongum subsp. globosum]
MARHLLKDCDAFHVIRFNQRTATERHEAWLTQRDHGVGGSDLSTILGLNKYATPYTLWLEKTGREQHMDISGKWAVVKGNALETALRARFRSLHPEWECYDGTDKSLVSNTHPCMHASLDGILYDEARGHGVLEIKTANAHRGATDWHDTDGNLMIPDYYMAQVTHYLSVTGWTWGVVYADIGDAEPVELMFERDEDDITAAITAAESFWGYVERDEPPALTVPDVDDMQTREQPDGFEQADDQEFDRLASLWQSLDDTEKTAKKQKTHVAEQLKTMVGADRAGLISSTCQVGYKTIHFKAQPEKTIPAKDAYEQRRFFVKPL